MKIPTILIVFAAAGSLPLSFARAECNFDKAIGSCRGSIKLVSSGGAKPSFNAEIEITSSTGACSKIEYVVQSTPYTAIVRSDGVEHESLFGTSPIRASDIKVSKCLAYKNNNPTSVLKKPKLSMHECISSFKSALKAGTNNGMGLAQWDEAYCQ